VQGSLITSRALQGAYETGRPPEAVGNGAQPDRLGAVLALVVGELARTWTKQSRRLTAATIAAKHGLADRGADELGRLADGVRATTPYTSVRG
jgi:hypothetical protein